jgi:leucine dehydrogenase
MVQIKRLDVSNHPQFDQHEEVVLCEDDASGLKAVIAVHNLNRGPSLGGCRIFPFASLDEALTDALRLSRGMTYKSALAGLPLGGGKAVIIADPRSTKTEGMMEAFGDAIAQLNGRYITAEDVGSNEADMIAISRRTKYVSGLPPETDPRPLVSGNPSPVTAKGCYLGLRAAVKDVMGAQASLSGLRVAVQGLGAVGFALTNYLINDGAYVIAADVNETACDRAKSRFGDKIEFMPVSEIHMADAHVFAPCALGAGLNARTIQQIKAKIIAGAANNQLETPVDDVRLLEQGIVYVPDYAINAGGIISVAFEYFGRNPSASMPQPLDETQLDLKVSAIGDTVSEILARAKMENRPTGMVADEVARERFAPTLLQSISAA